MFGLLEDRKLILKIVFFVSNVMNVFVCVLSRVGWDGGRGCYVGGLC